MKTISEEWHDYRLLCKEYNTIRKHIQEDWLKHYEKLKQKNTMNNIFEEIRNERERQDKKWGEQNHDPVIWSAILTEETGEVAKAAIDNLFDDINDVDINEYRYELIQTAAVAVAAIQYLDRNGWSDEKIANKSKWKFILKHNIEPETGQQYEVLTTDGDIINGYFMDWGFVKEGESENTLEDEGKQIAFFRKI